MAAGKFARLEAAFDDERRLLDVERFAQVLIHGRFAHRFSGAFRALGQDQNAHHVGV